MSFISISSVVQEQVQKYLSDFEKQISQNDWELNDQTQDYQFYKKDMYDWKAFKFISLFPGKSPQQCSFWVEDLETQKKWRQSIKEIYEVEKIDENTRILYERLEPKSIISSRDFVYVEVRTVSQEGDIQLFQTSVDHPLKPLSSDIVRGQIYFRVYQFKKDENGTQVLFSGCIHPRGSVLGILKGKIASVMKDMSIKWRNLILQQ